MGHGHGKTYADIGRCINRAVAQPALTNLNGMVILSGLLMPQAPLTPVVLSTPARVVDPGNDIGCPGPPTRIYRSAARRRPYRRAWLPVRHRPLDVPQIALLVDVGVHPWSLVTLPVHSVG